LEWAQAEIGGAPAYTEPAINRAYGLIAHARGPLERILAKGVRSARPPRARAQEARAWHAVIAPITATRW